MIRIIPSEVKFTFTAEEIAEELNIRVENLRIILKLFKFRKILGQYRLTERDIKRLKKIFKKNQNLTF